MTSTPLPAKDKIYASLEYCSVGCNSNPGSLCWSYPSESDSGGKDIIFYGACNAIVEYDFKAADGRGSTTRVLFGHTDKITSIRCSSDNVVLSCSRDRSARLWKNGCLLSQMKADAALLCGDIICWKETHWVVVGSVDDTVRIWVTEADFSPRDIAILRHGGHTPLCVRLYADIIRHKLLLFVGWTSCELQILELEETNGNKNGSFREVCSLSGHEDWIRDIDVRSVSGQYVSQTEDEILVASCGQDYLIRIWRIGPARSVYDGKMQVPKIVFDVGGEQLQAELETVLEGHTGWVYSARWRSGPDLCLLTASIDKSMIVWAPVESDKCDLWIERFRLGGIGGNNIGFLGATWDQYIGNRILAYGFHGSMHLWKCAGDFQDEWIPCVVPGGHFGPVTGLCWSPRGSYLLTCSTDQTTRLHGRWRRSGTKTWLKGISEQNVKRLSTDDEDSVWRELARPQVHGCDLFCVAALSETSFVSGAEEKVMRFFNATRNFIVNFNRISGDTLVEEGDLTSWPEGACVAALGLSNRAVYESDLKDAMDGCEDLKHKMGDDFYFHPVDLTSPPQEETLAQHTLFHEVRKLYGHGYELFACATSPDGSLIASSCKAQSVKHAAVFLWDSTSWKVVQRLEYHQLTVTCIAFNDDGRKLLTVSRDRTWALWEKQYPGGDLQSNFVKVACVDKTCSVHQRIIWGCAFAPNDFHQTSHESLGVFATCSRDKKVVIWKRDEYFEHETRTDVARTEDYPSSLTGNWKPSLILSVNDSARCVAFSRAAIRTCPTTKSLLLAVGLDCGHIELKLLQFNHALNEITSVMAFKLIAHGFAVNKISFRPKCCSRSEPKIQEASIKCAHLVELLASCSDDHSVKLHRIYVDIDRQEKGEE